MHVEVLCTGDELLTGLTADTNSPYFMDRLLRLGERVQRSSTVGDHRGDIIDALSTLSRRCDVVLVSGGLGPTADDITVECAAEAAGVPLVEHAPTLLRLKERFAQRGINFTENNARQARVPEGAEVIENPVGTAPMLALSFGRATFFFVPGVPREYRALVDREVLPRIAARLAREPGRPHHAFLLLRTIGLPESHLDARVAPIAARHPHVQLGFRTQAPENHLKLLATGASQGEAQQRLEAAANACRAALADSLFGEGDEDFPRAVLRHLREARATVAVAESCTGGQVAALLTDVPGASQAFVGGAVTYTNPLKTLWAGVSSELLAEHGAVHEQTARAMAEGIRAATGATFGVSTTGVAGPDGGTADTPVGTVFVGLAEAGKETQTVRLRLGTDRHRVQRFAAYAALEGVFRAVRGRTLA